MTATAGARPNAAAVRVAIAVLAVGGTAAVAASSGAFRASACAVPTLSGAIINVTAVDMGSMAASPMMHGRSGGARLVLSRHVVEPGAVSLLVHNIGDRTHEVVVLALRDGARIGERPTGADSRISESGSLGEASRSCGAGEGSGIPPRHVGWVTLRVPAGRYELVCNEPGHYDQGMYAELDVTPSGRRTGGGSGI